MAGHGPYPDSTFGKLHHIAHAPVDHHAGPSVALRDQAQVTPHQSATIAASAIHDKNATRPGCLEDLTHMRVVLEALQGDDRAAYSRLTSVILEDGWKDAQGA